MNLPKLASIVLAVATTVSNMPAPAYAGTNSECTALRIRIARAEYRRQGFVVRGEKGLNALAARLQCDLSIIDTRIDRATGLVIRATGTQYEQRAQNHLASLEVRRLTITRTSTRRRIRLESRLQKALNRMDARIASFRAQRLALGCPVRRR